LTNSAKAIHLQLVRLLNIKLLGA